jgi:hypothetical protein
VLLIRAGFAVAMLENLKGEVKGSVAVIVGGIASMHMQVGIFVRACSLCVPVCMARLVG